MKRLISTFFVVALLAGCATQSFDINPAVGPTGQATTDTSQPFFVGGIGQSTMTDAAEVCGGAANIARVETELTVLDSLLSALTGGIYSPRTARVYCL